MTQNKIYLIAFVLYVASLFLPVWTCPNHDPLKGIFVLGTGWFALIDLEPRWLCNIVVLLSAIHVFGKGSTTLKTLCFIFAIISTTTIFGPYICEGGGGSLDGHGSGMHIGGYLWIISLWVFAIATISAKNGKA